MFVVSLLIIVSLTSIIWPDTFVISHLEGIEQSRNVDFAEFRISAKTNKNKFYIKRLFFLLLQTNPSFWETCFGFNRVLRSSKSGFVKRFEKTAGPQSRLPNRKTNNSFLSKIKKNFLYIEAKRQTKSTFLVQRRMKHRK